MKFLKDYFVYFFLLFAFILFFAAFYTAWESGKRDTKIYVIDIKKVVDFVKRDYLEKSVSDLNKTSVYEKEMRNRFYLLDKYLKSKGVVIFERSALVYYPEGKIVDLTPEALKTLGLERFLDNGKTGKK